MEIKQLRDAARWADAEHERYFPGSQGAVFLEMLTAVARQRIAKLDQDAERAALARGGVTNQLATGVPREPTPEMIQAGSREYYRNAQWGFISIWQAMYDAARFTAESPETKHDT